LPCKCGGTDERRAVRPATGERAPSGRATRRKRPLDAAGRFSQEDDMPRPDQARTGDAAEMPATIRRSRAKAQLIWKETHDSAVEQYGEGERAHRTAYASLKHSYEKRGDRWVAKKDKGPSDPRSKQPTALARRGVGKTYGGLDYYGHTKAELFEIAKQLGARTTTHMTKEQLADAIARKQ
jgi:cation transport regulator ChaB